MLVRYSNDDVCKKRSANYERIKIGALLRTELAQIRLPEITAKPFALYRDPCLQLVRQQWFGRELAILQHLFETAIWEWDFAFLKNTILLAKIRLDCMRQSVA